MVRKPNATGFQFEGFGLPTTTPVPDQVFDVLLHHLTDPELRVLLYIIRRTFGFKKQSDDISLKQMVEGIQTKDGRVLDHGAGVSKPTASKAVKGLVQKGVIVAVRHRSPEKGDEPTTYTLRFTSTPVLTDLTRGGKPALHGGVNGLNTQQTVLQHNSITTSDDDMAASLEKFGVSKKTASRLAKAYPAALVLEKLDLVQWLVETRSPLVSKNPQGFLVKALEDGYLPKPPNGYKSRAKRAEEEEKQRAALEQQRKLAEQFQRAREEARLRLLNQHPPQAIENTGLTTATAWTKTLEALQQQVPIHTFASWLKDTLLVRVAENTAFILVSSPFAREYLERRLYQTIVRTLEQVLGHPVEVEFVVASAGATTLQA
jgi:hypothetical protein